MDTLDAKLLSELFIAGADALDAKKEYVNDLNVFPVPDGDTGTNMTMTIQSAAKEVKSISRISMETVCKAISTGSLRGARGNSGVILSQLLRGFTKVIKEYDTITPSVCAEAFEKAVETAYKAVMKPKEGTILTVARAGADMASFLGDTDIDITTFMETVIEHMRDVLNQTPDMLPVLKEAGVVDSGGEGLLVILEGAYAKLTSVMPKPDGAVKPDVTAVKKGSYAPKKSSDSAKKAAPAPKKKERKVYQPAKPKSDISTSDIKFGYCTEFIIILEQEFDDRNEEELKIFLEAIGDSIVVVADDEIVKVHVHTNMPGIALQKALTYGSLSKIKIDNMREEHEEMLALEKEKAEAEKASVETADVETTEVVEEAEVVETKKEFSKPAGFITVSAGAGLSEIFAGIGADVIIEGGQTMNPSTEDMLNAIDNIDAEVIYIMPNNSNIILTAEQAALLTEDKQVIVIPSKSIPQGIMALINYMPNRSVEDNQKIMTEEMKNVKTGSVTYSVRDTVINGREIKQGDIMGIADSEIVNTGAQVMSVVAELADHMIDDDSELVTLYYGDSTTEDEAELIASKIGNAHPDIEVEVHYGGQPVYYYYLSVE